MSNPQSKMLDAELNILGDFTEHRVYTGENSKHTLHLHIDNTKQGTEKIEGIGVHRDI